MGQQIQHGGRRPLGVLLKEAAAGRWWGPQKREPCVTLQADKSAQPAQGTSENGWEAGAEGG